MKENGKIVLELSPKSNIKRNSEGAFLKTKYGLMYIYTGFIGKEPARDYTYANLYSIFSEDGENFSEPKLVFEASSFNAMNIMSVSLLRMKDMSIALFFLVRKSFYNTQPYVALSYDEGRTFSVLKACTNRKSYFVMNNDRVIRLPSGRIILPLAEHVAIESSNHKPIFHPGTVTYMYSDDECKSFKESKMQLSLINRNTKSGLQEPGCVSLGGNIVYSWARTDLGKQYEMISLDGGDTWTIPQASIFYSPLSPLSMKRLPDGSLFAIWNPIPSYQTKDIDIKTGGRTPLVYSLSTNDGNNWSEPIAIEKDEMSGYCYTAIEIYNNSLFLAYCSGNPKEHISCLNMTRIRKIPLEIIYEQKKNCSGYEAMGIGFVDER